MLVEALRLIVVMAAVLSANRLASANPGCSAVAEPADHRPAGHGPRRRRSPTSLGGVVARGGRAAAQGGRGARLAPPRVGDRRAHRRPPDRRASSPASSSWPLLVFVHPTYVGASPSPRSCALVVITFTTRLAVRKRVELFGVLGVTPDAAQGIVGRMPARLVRGDRRTRARALPRGTAAAAVVRPRVHHLGDAGHRRLRRSAAPPPRTPRSRHARELARSGRERPRDRRGPGGDDRSRREARRRRAPARAADRHVRLEPREGRRAAGRRRAEPAPARRARASAGAARRDGRVCAS